MNNWVVNERGALSYEDVIHNAEIVRNFYGSDWSIEAISAILANMEVESGINPGRWENDDVGNQNGGFGLVQWTPATKVINWIEAEYPDLGYLSGEAQLYRIAYEVANGLQYAPVRGFNESFFEWTQSKKPPGYLAAAFLCNYERAKDTGIGAQLRRAKLAEKWYKQLTGEDVRKWIPPALLTILRRSGIF